LAEIGKRGVTLMLCDSTNATRPGFSASEKVVGQTIENIFRSAKTRIIIATFSSNVHRVQKIIENAVQCGRKVAVSGRSMENVVNLAIELGYLEIPAGTLVDLKMTKNIPDDQLVIITTGSQGEPMSALSRIASGEHKAVKLKKGDMVILSSTPVPGNEKTVSNVVNKLFEKGAEVIYSDIADIHVSGHACQEELKLILGLVKPKFFMPVHGEFRHLLAHKRLAVDSGMEEQNIFINEIGGVLSLTENSAKITETVQSGQLMIDGGSIGDVGNIVLRDRRHLGQDGLIVVVASANFDEKLLLAGPDIVSRGFVYVREAEELMESVRSLALEILEDCFERDMTDWNEIKNKLRDELTSFIYSRTKRKPMILPVIMNI
jgi:ribonuclease J